MASKLVESLLVTMLILKWANNQMLRKKSFPETKWKWYFVTKIVLTYCEKKNVLVVKKNFGNSSLKAENLTIFEITPFRTIHSNSKRSEQFAFSIQIGKNIGI